MTRSMGMPSIFILIMGTYASGTPCAPYYHSHQQIPQVNDRNTHRHFGDALRIFEHGLKYVKEVFSGHMLRDHAERVDVRAGPMHTKAIRPEREDLAASSVCRCLWEPTCERYSAHKFLDESCYPLEDNCSVCTYLLLAYAPFLLGSPYSRTKTAEQRSN